MLVPKFIEIRTSFSSDDILRRYRELNPRLYKSLVWAAGKIRGRIIIHINSTPYGGGVAELLRSEVPLENSLGLKSHWLVSEAPRQFFIVTKKIHNFLQGGSGMLSEKERMFYLSVNHQLGQSLQKFLRRFESGIVVVHDPQPLPLVRAIPSGFVPLLRLHLDLTAPNPAVLDSIRPFIVEYQQVILSNEIYQTSLPWLKKSRIKIILPAINPFSEKNKPMSRIAAENVLQRFGINCSRPIIAQVSRFDNWKDPLGVIQAYYLAKNKIPDLQLVLAGFEIAQDDPEAIVVFKRVKKHARGDLDIHLFSSPKQLEDISNDIFINALYTASTVVIQKSIREGFGLTITEAMWKGRSVVAGMTSGAMAQIKNGINGILVSSPEEAARAIVRLLKSDALRERLGRKAEQAVKQKFLFPRLALDMLRIYISNLKRNDDRI